MIRFSLLLVFFLSFSAGAEDTGSGADAGAKSKDAVRQNNIKVVEVKFVEKEPGVDDSGIRMLLSDEFLRIDAGFDEGDFILFERKDKIIRNVVHQDKTILTIAYTNRKLAPLPNSIKVEKQKLDLLDAPKIDNKSLKQIITRVNNADCKKSVVAVGLLPKAVKAMRELNQVLADQYVKDIDKMVLNEQQIICDMVLSSYEVNADLEYGFPVQSNRANGWGRTLVDFKKSVEVGSNLFVLPRDYRNYTLPE